MDRQRNKCLVLMLTADMNSGGKIIQAFIKADIQ